MLFFFLSIVQQGGQQMVIEGIFLTLGGKHTMQYIDDVLWNCMLATI